MASLETILNIRVEGTSAMVKLKDQITQTEKGLKELKTAQAKAGKGGKVFTQSIVEAETKLKGMRKELNANKNDVLKLNESTGKLGNSYTDLTRKNAALSVQLRKLQDPLGKNNKEFQKLSGQIDNNTNKLKKMDSAMGRSQRNVGNYGAAFSGLAMKIGAVVIAFKTMERVIGTFVDFEFAIKQVGVISGASAEEMKMLETQAKELGSSTAFTASEVAGLQIELSKLGFQPDQIENMTSGILDLSFAFGYDLAESSKQVGIVLKSFQLDASESTRVTDVMAAAFSNTAFDLEKFGVAFPKVGKLASEMGFELEDTVTLLAALSDTGMEASSAGTALKNIFLKLADPTGELSMALGRNITSVEELVPALQELEANGIDVAEMLEITDRRSVTAFASLLSGSEDLEILNKKLKESEGTAKSFAETMRDTLKGSIDETKSAAEGFAIELIEKMAPALEFMLGAFQGLFNVLSYLSPVIVGLTSAFVTYKLVIISARLMTYLYNGAMVISRVATIAMTHGTRGLTLSMRALGLAIKATPIGLIAGLAAGAIAMFSGMGDEVDETAGAVEELTEAEQKLKDKNDQLKAQAASRRKSQAEEMMNVKNLIKDIKDETKTREDRMKAVKALNNIAGTNISNLSNEVQLAKDLEVAYSSAVNAIKGKYILQAAEEEVVTLIEEELERTKWLEDNNWKLVNATEAQTAAEKKLKESKQAAHKWHMKMKKETGDYMHDSEKGRQFMYDEVNLNNALINRKQELWSIQHKFDKKNEEITKRQTEQNEIMQAAETVVEGLVIAKTEEEEADERKLTRYEKLGKAVRDEQQQLKRVIILRNLGKATQEDVTKQIEKLKNAKIDLNTVDKEVSKEMKKINDLFKEAEEAEETALEKREAALEVEENYLKVLDKLIAGGAKLADEQIAQALKVAKVKLDMALKVVKANEDVTEAEKENTAATIANIKKLQEEIQGYEDKMAETSETTPASGWLNRNLFGTGGEDDPDGGFTGADFVDSIAVTMDNVMGIMDEVNSLQNQNLQKELGTIETAKNVEIEAFKETREYKVMNQEQQDAALSKIAKKHDDKMLNLKTAQWEKDKQFARTSAIIAGAMAIMNIWAGQATGNVIADLVIKGIMTAGQIAMTGIQLTAINAQQAPTAELGGIMDNSFFAKGGMVHGNSHAQGGEKFRVGGRVAELEGGEAVINKRSTAMFRPMLSKMNVAGGGKKFADGGMMFGTDMLETQAVQMESLLGNNEPQEVLLVEADVTQSQRSVENIEAKASF